MPCAASPDSDNTIARLYRTRLFTCDAYASIHFMRPHPYWRRGPRCFADGTRHRHHDSVDTPRTCLASTFASCGRRRIDALKSIAPERSGCQAP
ncbi:hypothetical protein HJC23_008347 [Cyclotella cryptica]|uniref:Uncharacterized protein n=1 Tax=Cyclotella cryptica TaxID=29204 RepID=A0ABD3Q5B5_9STRA